VQHELLDNHADHVGVEMREETTHPAGCGTRAQLAIDRLVIALSRLLRVKPKACAPDSGTGIGGHDRITRKFHCLPLCRSAGMIHDLQQHVIQIRMRLLDFVEPAPRNADADRPVGKQTPWSKPT